MAVGVQGWIAISVGWTILVLSALVIMFTYGAEPFAKSAEYGQFLGARRSLYDARKLGRRVTGLQQLQLPTWMRGGDDELVPTTTLPPPVVQKPSAPSPPSGGDRTDQVPKKKIKGVGNWKTVVAEMTQEGGTASAA